MNILGTQTWALSAMDPGFHIGVGAPTHWGAPTFSAEMCAKTRVVPCWGMGHAGGAPWSRHWFYAIRLKSLIRPFELCKTPIMKDMTWKKINSECNLQQE